jgi:hypothetical protein
VGEKKGTECNDHWHTEGRCILTSVDFVEKPTSFFSSFVSSLDEDFLSIEFFFILSKKLKKVSIRFRIESNKGEKMKTRTRSDEQMIQIKLYGKTEWSK